MSTIESGQSKGMDEVTRRGNETGEPTSHMPEGYVEAYKESLRKLGVPEQDVEKCATYLADSSARAKRASRDNTVQVETARPSQVYDAINDQVSRANGLIRARRLTLSDPQTLYRQIAPILSDTQSFRATNGEAAKKLKDPIGTGRQVVEALSEITGTEIPLREETSNISGVIFKTDTVNSI